MAFATVERINTGHGAPAADIKAGTRGPKGGPTWGSVSVSTVCDILSFSCVAWSWAFLLLESALASPPSLAMSQDTPPQVAVDSLCGE